MRPAFDGHVRIDAPEESYALVGSGGDPALLLPGWGSLIRLAKAGKGRRPPAFLGLFPPGREVAGWICVRRRPVLRVFVRREDASTPPTFRVRPAPIAFFRQKFDRPPEEDPGDGRTPAPPGT